MPRPQHGGRRHKRRHRTQTEHGPKREHISELTPMDEPPDIESFEEWELGEEVQRAIKNMDIVKPTPIQSLSIGAVLEGRDVIAKAETGTGKTLAFGAPLLARMDPARSTVLSLVLCPTRELAQQVATVLEALALPRGIRVALVVGGDPIGPQINALQAGAQVVVGTPGRVLDLFQQRFLQFPWTECAVLDEADKMFEIGFLDDIKKILSYLPEERQTLLFSATFPTEVLKLARAETRDPLEVATKKGTVTADSIEQSWMAVDDETRPLVLTRLFEQSKEDDIFLVFCERRTEVDRLLRRLERLPFSVKALHGGYDQASRYRVMSAFREGTVKALLATDVASRGLDVDHVTHVVNYSVPRELEDYAHRIGRTGRAGRSGTAITLVPTSQGRKWRALLGQAKWPIREDDPPGSTRRRQRDDRDRPRGRRDEAERRPRRRDQERDAEDRPRRRDERGRRRDRDEDRPRRDEERPNDRDRGGREDRPRRDAAARDERRERPERSERGGRRRGGRGRGRGEDDRQEGRETERPRRRQGTDEPRQGQRDGGREREEAPFGALPEATAEKPRERSERPPRRRAKEGARSEKDRERPKREDEQDSGKGFGAGLA